MKKFILMLTIIVISTTVVSARQFLVCLGGYAYFIETNSSGIIIGWSNAGGCAGGDWAIELRIDDLDEHETDAELAEKLNQDLDVENYYSPESHGDIEDLQTLVDNCTTEAWLKPGDLLGSVEYYLRAHGARYSNISGTNGGLVYSIYPNPSSDNISISSVTPLFGTDIEIYNSMGQIIMKERFTGTDKYTNISIKDFTSGIYFVKFFYNSQSVSNSFIKQ